MQQPPKKAPAFFDSKNNQLNWHKQQQKEKEGPSVGVLRASSADEAQGYDINHGREIQWPYLEIRLKANCDHAHLAPSTSAITQPK